MVMRKCFSLFIAQAVLTLALVVLGLSQLGNHACQAADKNIIFFNHR